VISPPSPIKKLQKVSGKGTDETLVAWPLASIIKPGLLSSFRNRKCEELSRRDVSAKSLKPIWKTPRLVSTRNVVDSGVPKMHLPVQNSSEVPVNVCPRYGEWIVKSQLVGA
jgi:hypothetical protein